MLCQQADEGNVSASKAAHVTPHCVNGETLSQWTAAYILIHCAMDSTVQQHQLHYTLTVQWCF